MLRIKFVIAVISARKSKIQIALTNIGFVFSRFQTNTIASPEIKTACLSPENA
jgi:hypothetical protein